MAISRHDPEWQRVVSMAALGGVRFYQSLEVMAKPGHQKWVFWYAELPSGARYRGRTKFDVAKLACAYLCAAPILPDAASPQTAPSGPDGT